LKTRTTNDNTDVSPKVIRHPNDFFCFHRIGAHGEKYYPQLANANFHGIVLKNPFTMSKTNQLARCQKVRYRRRISYDGKLVAYILEDDVRTVRKKRSRSERQRNALPKRRWWSLSGSNR
jgi:hypothetical protein